jgi:4-hydroxy-2-oxoheptanedioate aldolase
MQIASQNTEPDCGTLLGALQAVAPYPAQPVLRIPQGDAMLIKQVLEIGATTLLVPMVEAAAQARELMRATR